MNEPVSIPLSLLAAYLIGSLPFGYFVARLVLRDDIRNHGSGNIGATNVARVLGAKWGSLVLFLDAMKGGLPTWLLPQLLIDGSSSSIEHVRVGCGIATIVGHSFPIWLQFRGGKGVATALGVVSVLSWPSTLVAAGTFAILFFTTRIVSLGSVCAATAFGVSQFVRLGSDAFTTTQWSITAFSMAVPSLILWRHRSNIVRLLRGEEQKLRFRSQSPETGEQLSESDATDTENAADNA